MKKILSIVNFWFVCVLIVFLPFSALVANVLGPHSGLSIGEIFWITHWYEPVLLALLMIAILSRRRKPNAVELAAAALVVLGIVSIALRGSSDLGRQIEGFRFTLFGALTLLFASIAVFSAEQIHKLRTVYIVLAVAIAIWGVFELALPLKYWGAWGLINPTTVFGFGWHSTGTHYQIASVLGGPNQLASYLLPAFFLLLVPLVNRLTDWSSKRVLLGLAGAIVIAASIFLTYSRSAILGLMCALLVWFFLLAKRKWLRVAVFASTIVLVGLIAVLYQRGSEIVTHGASQAGHLSSLSATLDEIKTRVAERPLELVLGAGLGTAGPIVLKYGNGLISESWYLQLVLEIGLLGLLLWLILISLVTMKLFRAKETALALGLVSVSVAAIFLHTWSDNPALTISLLLLIGMIYNHETNIN